MEVVLDINDGGAALGVVVIVTAIG